jgi:hypothetical protein
MSSSGNTYTLVKGKTDKTSAKPAHTKADRLFTFRALGRKKRAALATGPVIELVSHDGQEVVTQMSLRLFDALSEKKDLVKETKGVHRIWLLTDTLPVAVKTLIARVNKLTNPDVNVLPMESTGNLHKDIHIASAADQLGLSAYTQRMLNAHWQRLKTTIPTKADVDVICNIDTALGNKIFNIVSHDLAKLSWDGKIPNPTAFQEYLKTNHRFYTAVNEHFAKWESNAEAFAAREARRRRREEQQWQAEERARSVAMKESQKRARERVKFEAIKKEQAELGQVVREKMRHAGSKYTAKEARFIYNSSGRRVPVTGGG